MQVYYRNKETGKIEAKYVNCDTNSTVFNNSNLYEKIETEENLLLEVRPEPSPPLKTPLELRIEAIEKEIGMTEKESWIDKIKGFLHL